MIVRFGSRCYTQKLHRQEQTPRTNYIQATNMDKFLKLNNRIEAEFSFFDELLKRRAAVHGFDFYNKAGTIRGRSLRKENDNGLRVVIDLCLIDGVLKILDQPDKEIDVELTWGAWRYPTADRKTFWHFTDECYSGSIRKLRDTIESVVDDAIESVGLVTPDFVKSKGVLYP